MALIGRKMLKSERARMNRINVVFARFAKFFILAYGLFVICVWVSERASLRVESVAVEGAHAVSSRELKQIASRVLSEKLAFRIQRDNSLLYPRNKVLKEITDSYPRIKEVHLNFETRHHLVVQIEEFEPSFLYCLSHTDQEEYLSSNKSILSDIGTNSTSSVEEFSSQVFKDTKSVPDLSDCYFSNNDGYVFAQAPEYSGYPLLVIISSASTTPLSSLPSPVGERVINSFDKTQIQEFIEALSKLSLRTQVVYLRNAHDVEFQINEPWSILWSTNEDPIESTKYLAVVLGSMSSTKLESGEAFHHVDLRFGNKVFYK